MVRVKKIAEAKGMSLKEVAEKMGITYVGLAKIIREDSPSMPSLKKMAAALGCDIHELIDTSEHYAHFYDPDSGEWLGIRKKS